MAGAQPEYLPVILAHGGERQTARSSSTTSFATISVVNGPIRNEIGMNSGIGAMGPYNHANATIGRAYSLLSHQSAGRLGAGRHLHGLARQLVRLHARRFPEAEERSPWQPFHVQQGFKPTDCTVSIFFGGWYTHAGYGPRETWQEKMIRCLTAIDHYQPPLLVMDPIVAAAVRRSRLRQQGEADRLVRGECATAGARLLGRPVDPDADASARGRRRRAVREPAQGRARRAGARCSSRRTSTSSSPAARRRAPGRCSAAATAAAARARR